MDLKKMFDKLKELVCRHNWATDFYTLERVFGHKTYEQYCVKCGKRHPNRVQREG
jgi:hypothetical protein